MPPACSVSRRGTLRPSFPTEYRFLFIGRDCARDSEGWQSEVAARCVGNPVLTLAVCAALAGPLLALATLRNDTLLVLDEIGEAKAQDVCGIIYALGNGTGRQRGKVSGLPRQVQ